MTGIFWWLELFCTLNLIFLWFIVRSMDDTDYPPGFVKRSPLKKILWWMGVIFLGSFMVIPAYVYTHFLQKG